MSIETFGTTFAATLIALTFFAWGRHLSNKEERTGDTKGLDLFLFAILGPGFAMFFFGIDHPFWGELLAMLFGMFIAANVAYYGFLLVWSLRQKWTQLRQPRSGD